jgi:hypothetical protein
MVVDIKFLIWYILSVTWLEEISADGGCPMQPLSQKHPLGKPTPNRYGQIVKTVSGNLMDLRTSTEREKDQHRSKPEETRVDEGEKEVTPTPATVQGIADGGCPMQPLSPKHPLGEPSPSRYVKKQSEENRLLIDNPVISMNSCSMTLTNVTGVAEKNTDIFQGLFYIFFSNVNNNKIETIFSISRFKM